jgi:hypothetical protein
MTTSKGKAVDDKSKLSTRLRGKLHHDRRLTTHILYYPIIETTGNLVVMYNPSLVILTFFLGL